MNIQALPSDWYALYTKGRHEKFIDDQLKKKSIEAFLPIRRVKKRWSDRTVIVDEPLFSSYLFVKTNPMLFSNVLKTKGAVKFVSAQARPIPIEESVIRSLKTLIDQEIAIDPFPYLAVGQRVCVRSGIFKGVEGFIVRKDDKKCRVVISIDAIMTSIAIEVDSYLVDKV